ncbi:hypothetical protein EJB05_46187, partial [Eragrostis curvula]
MDLDEVVVKIDGSGNGHSFHGGDVPAGGNNSPAKVWRDGSYKFCNNDDGGGGDDDVAAKAFSFKNRPGNAAEEDQHTRLSRSSSTSNSDAPGGASTTSTVPGAGTPLRAKPQSRLLMDPVIEKLPPPGNRSGPMSGPIDEEEEDDPFLDDGIPDDYFKHGKLDALTIVQWVSLFLITTALVCSLVMRIMSKKVLGLHLWKWELLVFELICGRLISGWVIRIAMFAVERNLVLRKRVLCFVYEVRRAVQNALWLGLVLASWSLLFDKKVQQAKTNTPAVLPYVTKTLSRPPPLLDENQSTISNELQEGVVPTCKKLYRLNQKKVSAWNIKRLMRALRFGTLTTMDEQIQQATGEGDELATEIRSEYEAQIAAKKIFHNVANHDSKYIYLSNLMRFMSQDEAIKAMDLFEGAQEHKRVSKRSLKSWVVNAFRDRKALALTLNDTKSAVNKLNQMANVVVGIIVFALWLLILDVATTQFFVFLGSQILVAVFIFGDTLKAAFEATMFLFVMHPFDVGDRCEIEDVQVVVEEMNIMTTVFLRGDNLKIYYPNSELATKPIMNYYRSPDMGEGIDFSIHVATPIEKLALMKERILRYINNKKEHWYPGAMVVLRDVDNTSKLKVSIWLRHTLNFQDMGMRFVRRELVLQEMIKVLKDLEIEYRMLPLDVNVRNAHPIQSTRMPTTWTRS